MGSWRRALGLGLVVCLAPGSARAHFGDDRPDVPRDPAGAPTPPPGGDGGPPIDLLPRLPMAPVAGWFLEPEPTPDSPEERAEAQLDAWLDREIARDRIEAGDVDGWYHEVGRSMRQAFRPDRDEVEDERRAGMTLLQRAYDELRRYAAGPEAPQGPMRMIPRWSGGPPLPGSADADREALQQSMDWRNPLYAPATWYRVDLRITHNPEGDQVAAWVLRTSGIQALDDAALEAARSGAIHLPAPPERVVGDRAAIRSDWAFEMGDVATQWGALDPTGLTGDVSCVDDPIQGTQCAILGRGIVRTRVWLIGVVDATHQTPAERRAARRAARRARDEGVTSGRPAPPPDP